jgi:arylsulfatase/arylsulfatase A
MRAHDQGFDQALVHRGGGLAQPADPIENGRRYTDPILFRNGQHVQTKGYCTDVYFEAAMEFIDKAHQANRNFFVYLPTNAPHAPFHDVPEDLRKHYMTKQDALEKLIVGDLKGRRRAKEIDTLARIAAMITNVDANVGRLFAKLNALKLTGNTLVMFLVDNGPNSRRYVGTLRGKKTEVYEGGVRSPLWLHWPDKLKAGYSRDELAAHIDLMPTILDACRVDPPRDVKLDGRSLLPLLMGRRIDWSDRTVVIQSHRGDQPTRYGNFMIRNQQWKLLHASGFGRERLSGPPKFELYNLQTDPGETMNVIDAKPAVAARLQQAYDKWFDDVSSTRPDNYAPPRIHIGTPHENPTVLTRQDWRGGTWAKNSVGYWKLYVAQTGVYDVQCVFDPSTVDETVRLTIGSTSHETEVSSGSRSCQFQGIRLVAGDTQLQASLVFSDKRRGVYQVTVTRLKKSK